MITQNTGKFLSIAIAVIILTITIPQRLAIPYYHMIDDQDYQAFIWIKNNLNQGNEKVILDPWKGTAFSAITGKRVYTRIHVAPLEDDNKAYDFLRSGSANTAFLKQNGITVIYTRLFDFTQSQDIELDSANPDLIELAENIYVLK